MRTNTAWRNIQRDLRRYGRPRDWLLDLLLLLCCIVVPCVWVAAAALLFDIH